MSPTPTVHDISANTNTTLNSKLSRTVILCDHVGPRMALPRVGGPNNPQGPKVFVCTACYIRLNSGCGLGQGLTHAA